MNHAWLPATCLLLLLAACGGPAPAGDAERENTEDRRDGAFDDLAGTIDRAEAVEGQVLEKKQRIDDALEDAETNRDPERG